MANIKKYAGVDFEYVSAQGGLLTTFISSYSVLLACNIGESGLFDG